MNVHNGRHPQHQGAQNQDLRMPLIPGRNRQSDPSGRAPEMDLLFWYSHPDQWYFRKESAGAGRISRGAFAVRNDHIKAWFPAGSFMVPPRLLALLRSGLGDELGQPTPIDSGRLAATAQIPVNLTRAGRSLGCRSPTGGVFRPASSRGAGARRERPHPVRRRDQPPKPRAAPHLERDAPDCAGQLDRYLPPARRVRLPCGGAVGSRGRRDHLRSTTGKRRQLDTRRYLTLISDRWDVVAGLCGQLDGGSSQLTSNCLARPSPWLAEETRRVACRSAGPRQRSDLTGPRSSDTRGERADLPGRPS